MSQNTLILLSILALLLPFFGFLILIFFGRRLPRQGDVIGTSFIFGSLVLSFVVFLNKILYFHEPIEWKFEWVNFGFVQNWGEMKITLGILIDNLSATMLIVVGVVSFLVHVFSIGYMKGDVRYSRYFAYLNFFTFSMLGIVLTNNFFTMYVFWELVGVSSYLLIGHWYEKKSASDAAKKAFIVNRVGDFGFFVGIMIIWVSLKTFNFGEVFAGIEQGKLSGDLLTIAGILVFMGAIGKSAQFPLHVWLPDAMEGPTPVSALIHAATMVAAGVYLTARTYAMMSADALTFIAYIGAITAFISATIAITQTDIKRVLAYSTISQLGYMIMSLGSGAYVAGFFHLVTHAAFKAGLFLGSGSVIHAMHHALHKVHDHHTDPQDIRNMGGLKKKMPITYYTFLIYTLAISGIPLTSGFLSKDSILAGAFAFGKLSGHILIPLIGFLVAGLTAFYMFRLLILTFHGEPKRKDVFEHIHESPKVMTVPLVIFAILSLWFIFGPNPFDASTTWIEKNIHKPKSVVPVEQQYKFNLPVKIEHGVAITEYEHALHEAHVPAMLISLGMAGLGILFAFLTYQWKKIDAEKVANSVKPVYTFLKNKWYFDELYQNTFVLATLGISRFAKWFDLKVIDGIVDGSAHLTKLWSFSVGKFDWNIIDGLVNLLAYITGFFGYVARFLQNGKVQTYIVYVIFAVIILFYIFVG
ncbi:MAG: NADH-quinone oxidoreductase subunit L [Candidatus Kryptonium sp.]|nr:NADH-quinone oxidoreductase subunit L [Candidatus Kryptonium sp.]MCX7761467.1 NADH-quinone oxidoreductase subunit L [Candidatus Kryptonium sp.]MDW8109678.1 NADH-quinone oxidoreductase subunit L [Candidatus Kryptonium sp.]